MSSGIALNPECLEKFQELKLGKKCKYIIFKVNKELTEIVIDKASQGGDYEDFQEDLPPDQCRWGVFDLEYRIEVEGEPHAKRNKIVFVSWSPDNAKIKDKMLASSSQATLRRALIGVHVEVQATDFSEVAKETVVDKAKRTGK